jgi:hypothetical protein
MRTIARHTIAFGRAFTLVFLLACSGFATILHICAGEESKRWDTSGASGQAACPNGQLPLPVARMFVHNVGDCNKKAIVGGIAVFQALEEKDSKAQNVKALSLLTSAFVLPAPDNTSSWSINSCPNRNSPASMEKFILNAILLI